MDLIFASRRHPYVPYACTKAASFWPISHMSLPADHDAVIKGHSDGLYLGICINYYCMYIQIIVSWINSRRLVNVMRKVMIRSALYGRMKHKDCIERNDGYIGCSNNVLEQVDTKCSGNTQSRGVMGF